MKDLEILLDDAPGAFALVGETLGQHGISLEGGGMFSHDGKKVAHFLVAEPERAKQVLEQLMIRVISVNEVVIQKLRQDVHGQLGLFCRRMSDAGVSILVQYSDHEHRLIVVVDEYEKGREVSEKWMKEWWSEEKKKEHGYRLTAEWTGNTGKGTAGYLGFERNFIIEIAGKPPISGSADPAFRGDRSKYNPEELLLAALSSCHMLWYLHLCSEAGIIVTAYTDESTGTMLEMPNGSGRFSVATLCPMVTVSEASMKEKALTLHKKANEMCFIARSVNFPVMHQPSIRHHE